MLPFKSTGLERAQPDLSPTSPRVEAELALWEQLAFSFDMDNEPRRSTSDERAHNPRRSRSGSQSQPVRSNTASMCNPFQQLLPPLILVSAPKCTGCSPACPICRCGRDAVTRDGATKSIRFFDFS